MVRGAEHISRRHPDYSGTLDRLGVVRPSQKDVGLLNIPATRYITTDKATGDKNIVMLLNKPYRGQEMVALLTAATGQNVLLPRGDISADWVMPDRATKGDGIYQDLIMQHYGNRTIQDAFDEFVQNHVQRYMRALGDRRDESGLDMTSEESVRENHEESKYSAAFIAAWNTHFIEPHQRDSFVPFALERMTTPHFLEGEAPIVTMLVRPRAAGTDQPVTTSFSNFLELHQQDNADFQSVYTAMNTPVQYASRYVPELLKSAFENVTTAFLQDLAQTDYDLFVQTAIRGVTRLRRERLVDIAQGDFYNYEYPRNQRVEAVIEQSRTGVRFSTKETSVDLNEVWGSDVMFVSPSKDVVSLQMNGGPNVPYNWSMNVLNSPAPHQEYGLYPVIAYRIAKDGTRKFLTQGEMEAVAHQQGIVLPDGADVGLGRAALAHLSPSIVYPQFFTFGGNRNEMGAVQATTLITAFEGRPHGKHLLSPEDNPTLSSLESTSGLRQRGQRLRARLRNVRMSSSS